MQPLPSAVWHFPSNTALCSQCSQCRNLAGQRESPLPHQGHLLHPCASISLEEPPPASVPIQQRTAGCTAGAFSTSCCWPGLLGCEWEGKDRKILIPGCVSEPLAALNQALSTGLALSSPKSPLQPCRTIPYFLKLLGGVMEGQRLRQCHCSFLFKGTSALL